MKLSAPQADVLRRMATGEALTGFRDFGGHGHRYSFSVRDNGRSPSAATVHALDASRYVAIRYVDTWRVTVELTAAGLAAAQDLDGARKGEEA